MRKYFFISMGVIIVFSILIFNNEKVLLLVDEENVVSKKESENRVVNDLLEKEKVVREEDKALMKMPKTLEEVPKTIEENTKLDIKVYSIHPVEDNKTNDKNGMGYVFLSFGKSPRQLYITGGEIAKGILLKNISKNEVVIDNQGKLEVFKVKSEEAILLKKEPIEKNQISLPNFTPPMGDIPPPVSVTGTMEPPLDTEGPFAPPPGGITPTTRY